MSEERLLAWLEPRLDGYIAAFIAQGTTRQPARRWFATEEEARSWVYTEASAFEAIVTWHITAPVLDLGRRAMHVPGGLEGAEGRREEEPAHPVVRRWAP